MKKGLVYINLGTGNRAITPLNNVTTDIKSAVEKTRYAIVIEALAVPREYNCKKMTHNNPNDWQLPSPQKLGIK